MRTALCTIATFAIATALIGQAAEKKKATTPKTPPASILHPELAVGPDAGTYDKPMGTLGDKPAEPWTGTTIAAAVDKKNPQPGPPITVVGEIIDLSCYLQLGKHGEPHKTCGTKCLQNNQPIGLLAKDGTVYMLMEEEHDPRRDGQVSLRQAAIDHFAHIMEVNGTEATVGGYKAIFVQGYAKK